jgi:hypothetical protein
MHTKETSMKTPFRAALAAAALLGFGACSSPTSATNYFDVSYRAAPEPAPASVSTGVQYKIVNADDSITYLDYAYRTHFVVTITENGGYPLDITAINLTFQQATGGIVISPSGGDQIYFKFSSQAATNHINAHGTGDIAFDVWYKLPNQGSEGLATVSFAFKYKDKDNNEFTYSSNHDVKVGP